MGRRALRRTNSQLDLSRHLVALAELPSPWDASALFGRTAPLELEIGTGKGLFLEAAAARNPATDYLGVEIAARYARFAAARLGRRELANAKVIHGDALPLVRDLLPDASLQAVHVYFPDPWWKSKHKKRRVMNPTLLANVERTLELGGKLHFWTDVEEYFRTSLEIIAAYTRLEGPHEVVEQAAEHDLDYRTHFERRTRLHNETVFRAEFRKVAPHIPGA